LQQVLSHFYDDLCALTFMGSKDNGGGRRATGCETSTGRQPLSRRWAEAKLVPRENDCCKNNNGQRGCFLPIHAAKIARYQPFATGNLQKDVRPLAWLRRASN
jgi:hypothetical protein